MEAIRNRSRAGNSGPWVTDFDEMAKKTVFRRLSKWLPISSEYRDALDKDADQLPAIQGMVMEKAAQAKPVFTRPAAPAPALELEMDEIPMDTPEASAAAAPKARATKPAAPLSDDELPVFEPDTPQKSLALALSDASVAEADFMRSLKKLVPAAKKAATLSELTDHVATEALKEIDLIIGNIEEAAQ